MVRNLSKQQITINQETGIRLFTMAANRWVEVKNEMNYSSADITLLPDANFDPAKIEAIFVLPDLANHGASSRLRVYIIGIITDGQQNTAEFSSSLDLVLKP